MFENVFVGVDDPESGADALERARRLASPHGEREDRL
jgi:nucleotide-binding universal stress UspA family protein